MQGKTKRKHQRIASALQKVALKAIESIDTQNMKPNEILAFLKESVAIELKLCGEYQDDGADNLAKIIEQAYIRRFEEQKESSL